MRWSQNCNLALGQDQEDMIKKKKKILDTLKKKPGENRKRGLGQRMQCLAK